MKGHGLLFEGAPFAVDLNGQLVRTNMGTAGLGRGVCRCGAMSRVLDSGNARKAWHRAHKAGTSEDHFMKDCWCKERRDEAKTQ